MDRRKFLKNTGWSFLGLAASGSLLGSCAAGSKEAKKIMPSDIQGASLKPILVNEGKTPADWRKAAYYHYYEYPAEHSVKRHYGIRTQDFKLIHFYNDIDEWEMYDMKADPREMNSVFGKPEYAKVQKELMELLQDTQKQYKDTDPDEKEKVLFKGDRRQMQNR